MNRRRFLLTSGTVGLTSASRFTAFAAEAAQAAPLKTGVPLDELKAQLLALIPRVMEEKGVPGLSIALIRDSKLVWAQGFGVKAAGSPGTVEPDTLFEAASLTKPVVAFATLKLCETGALKLDEPLAPHIDPDDPDPFRSDNDEWLQLVTPRQVLTHTSGLPNQRVPGQPVKFQFRPGEKWGYSGQGFLYMQRAIEKVTGALLDSFVGESLFGPLGMKDSSLVWKDAFEARFALGHIARSKVAGPIRKVTRAQAPSSLLCTASDYARFMISLFASHASGGAFLSTTSREAMLKPGPNAATEIGWGLGVGIQESPPEPSFWHWGNNGSRYNAFAVGYPRAGLGLVVLTNSGAGLRACSEIVPAALGGDHPAFRWRMVVGV